MRLLLAADADVNARTGDGETVLMTAARRGRLNAVRVLLHQRNAQILPYAKDFVVGNTALHEAVMNGHEEIAKLLLARFPKLAAIRNTLHRQTASFGSSFRLLSAMHDAYKSAPIGFSVPTADSVGVDLDLRSETNEGATGFMCHRAIVFARCAVLKDMFEK